MSKTVYHAASRQWLSAAYARQLDEALAAARQAAPGSPHETENRKNQLAALTATLDTAVAELYGTGDGA